MSDKQLHKGASSLRNNTSQSAPRSIYLERFEVIINTAYEKRLVNPLITCVLRLAQNCTIHVTYISSSEKAAYVLTDKKISLYFIKLICFYISI